MTINVDTIGSGKATTHRVLIYGGSERSRFSDGRVVWSGRRVADAEAVAAFLRTQHETVQRAAWERGA